MRRRRWLCMTICTQVADEQQHCVHNHLVDTNNFRSAEQRLASCLPLPLIVGKRFSDSSSWSQQRVTGVPYDKSAMLQQHVACQLLELLIGTHSIALHRDIHRSSSVGQLVKLLELLTVMHNIASRRAIQRSSSVVQLVKLLELVIVTHNICITQRTSTVRQCSAAG